MKNGRSNFEFEKAFLPPDAQLEACVEEAFERGEKEMRKRLKIRRLLSIAAVLGLVFGLTSLAANEMNAPKEDNAVFSAGQPGPVSTAEAELVSGEEKQDFIRGDRADEDALYSLLNTAYRDYCETTGETVREGWIDALALGKLRSVPSTCGSNRDGWAVSVSDILKGYLGFDKAYIRENDLVNSVVACLEVLESSGDTAWNRQLEEYVLEMYDEYTSASLLEMDSRDAYSAIQTLLEIPSEYGNDAAQWTEPILDCLQESLGIGEDYSRKNGLIEEICARLQRNNPD